VASEAGVSTATVSRVLAAFHAEAHRTGISRQVAETTRLRVMAAAKRLDYRMNHAARTLKTRFTMTVGVLFPELANDFFMDVAEGLERELSGRGYTMLMASTFNSIGEERQRVFTLADRVDGMVVIPAGSRGEHLQALADEGMPMVLVDRLLEGVELEAISSDNEDGMFRLTKALLDDGFSRIAFVGGEITLSAARERLSGYGRALAEAGIQSDPSWICLGGMEVEDGYRRMESLLERENPPEAMVAVNMLIHLGMERCLLDRKERGAIPPPVIAGFDESRYSPFLPACRYTACQDAVGIGRKAGERIVSQIREKIEGTREKPGERIVRLPVTIHRS
jgi:LacI family transcriptional regulator